MANITSSRRHRKRSANVSAALAPERLRPLKYKTAMRLAFEGALRHAGVPEDVIAAASGGTRTTTTWKGTRAA